MLFKNGCHRPHNQLILPTCISKGVSFSPPSASCHGWHIHWIHFMSCHFVAQPTALCYITCVWLAFRHLWLRNNPKTTSTPACNLWKKTIAHLRLVILMNKCSNLGIWSTKRVSHWNFNSENLENGTSRTEVLWDNFQKISKLLNFCKANHSIENPGWKITVKMKFLKIWEYLVRFSVC